MAEVSAGRRQFPAAVRRSSYADSPVMSDRLIGRDHELAVAATFLDGAAEHAGRALLIEGDAGIGKTALVRAVIAAAGTRLRRAALRR